MPPATPSTYSAITLNINGEKHTPPSITAPLCSTPSVLRAAMRRKRIGGLLAKKHGCIRKFD